MPKTARSHAEGVPSLKIFCGKGGVGKSSLALAWGLAAAGSGKKVLVVTSHPLEELALSISLDGLSESDPEAAENLFVIHIDARRVLADMVRRQISSRMMTNAVISSRIYKSLVEIVPGLKELAFLSRLKDIAEGEEEAPHPYRYVVWDAPATGHFIETLKVTKSFELFLTGPFAVKAAAVAEFFSSIEIDLFPVANLEEMAVEETIDLVSQVAKVAELQPNAVLVNLVSPAAFLSDREFEAFENSLQREVLNQEARRFISRRCQVEREQLAVLQSRIPCLCYPINRISQEGADLEFLMEIASQLRPIHV